MALCGGGGTYRVGRWLDQLFPAAAQGGRAWSSDINDGFHDETTTPCRNQRLMPNLPHAAEIALLLVLAYLAGCIAGYALRRVLSGETALALAGTPAPQQPVAGSAAGAQPALVRAPALEPVMSTRPPQLATVPSKRAPGAAEPAKSPPAQPDSGKPTLDAVVLVEEDTPLAAEALPARNPGEVRFGGRPVERRVLEPVPLLEVPSATPTESSEAEEVEAAAMRAIEGSSSPRSKKPGSAAKRVVHGTPGAEAPQSAATPSADPPKTAPPAPAMPASTSGQGTGRPRSLDFPRPEGKDNLSNIKGIDQAVELTLNDLGIFHFDQIAAWDQDAVLWLEAHFGFRGRIGAEKWIEQARDLVDRPAEAPPAPARK